MNSSVAQASTSAASTAPAIHGAGVCFMRYRPIPPPAVCPNWLPDWNHPAARPRVAGVVLWAISPSVAKARKVAARFEPSTSRVRSGTVRTEIGVTLMEKMPPAITVAAMQYHVLRPRL